MRSRSRLTLLTLAVVLSALLWCPLGAGAQEEDEGPPLPLHTIEGVGGLVLTPTAYLAAPPAAGEDFGMPSLSVQTAWVGHRDLQVLAATWNVGNRLELGYALNRFDVGNLNVGSIASHPEQLYMHHLNARYNLIQEGQWDKEWMPAVTFGAHYKINDDIDDINNSLGDALDGIGYDDNDGLDFTLTASKTLGMFPRPVIATAGLRASKASQLGLTGFGDDYLVSFEGSVLTLVTDRLALGAEFRQKREALGEIDGLVESEDSWWDVHAAYILSPNASLYAVIGDAGAVLEHSSERLWGVVFKYDF
ncbi:MAG: DUF3034 family protein [Candidatus Brocadiia bacterium]